MGKKEKINKEEKVEKKEAIEKPEKIEIKEREDDNIVISPEVIASIAGVAISKIPGVETSGGVFFDSIPDILRSKEKKSKGIRVDIFEGKVNIFVNIVVDYGLRIPDIAFEIQVKVKENVEGMTGLDVREVNVNVQGIRNFSEKQDINEEEK